MEVDMEALAAHAQRFAALGHPARLAILRHLVQGGPAGCPAGEVQRALGIPASTLSHHLGTLAAAGLARVERQGTCLCYRADYPALQALTTFLWQDCCRRDPAPAPQAPPPEPAPPAPPRPAPRTQPPAWDPILD